MTRTIIRAGAMTVLVIVGAIVLGPQLAAALPSAGGGGGGGGGGTDVAVSEYTVGLDVQTAEPQGCVDVPLPAGDFVLEHVQTWFGLPADAFLSIPTAMEVTREGQTTIGRTRKLVWLGASDQNLAVAWPSELHTALVIHDGFVPEHGALYRDADDAVKLCARDDDESRGFRGDGIVSGRTLGT